MTLEVKGISFVVTRRFAPAIGGLVVDVQDYFGREALVAYHDVLSGSC